MKNKLKQNGGFAIIYVIFFLFVLSLMGTAMYMYSISSLRSVRYLSNRKKAEYLAQAGVEATSYAYQLTVNSGEAGAISLVSSTANEDENRNKIDTNYVYLVYASGAYKYVDFAGLSSYTDEQVIGCYKVIISTKMETTPVKLLKDMGNSFGSTGTEGSNASLTPYWTQIKESERFFEGHGYSLSGKPTSDTADAIKDKTIGASTKRAHITEPVQALGKYYGNKDNELLNSDGVSLGLKSGVIDGSVTGTKQIKDDSGNKQTVPKATVEGFEALGEYKTGSELTLKVSLFNNIPLIGKYIGVNYENTLTITSQTIPILMAYTTGNMIMNAPECGTITFRENQSNMVSFIGKHNLFLNSDLDVTPTQGYFNAMFLRGNNIVINGDVDIYVYGFTRSTFKLFQNSTNIASAIGGNYAWSTVVIGTAEQENVTASDPGKVEANIYRRRVVKSDGTEEGSKNGYGMCGKVFFGGNVFVNMQIPNVGTYRYKVFSAGDIYYFDDNLPQQAGGSEGYGIDLFKYFIDYSIATKKYSDSTLERFAEIMGLYYSSSGSQKQPTTYVLGSDSGITYSAMRKVDRTYFKDGFAALIPPTQAEASQLIWEKG